MKKKLNNQKTTTLTCLNEEATVKNELKHIEQQLQQEEATVERMTDRSTEMQKELDQATVQKEVTEKLLHKAETA